MAVSALSEPEFVKKACVKLGHRAVDWRGKGEGGSHQIGGVVERAELVGNRGVISPAVAGDDTPQARRAVQNSASVRGFVIHAPALASKRGVFRNWRLAENGMKNASRSLGLHRVGRMAGQVVRVSLVCPK